MSTLSPEEVLRYGRHLVMPEVGMDGQERLRDARVLCVGAGGLGSPASLYLAAAGVGTIGIVDDDAVDLSNIQRQLLFATGDVGRAKTEAAADRLGAINPHVKLELHRERLVADNVMDLLGRYDVVVDGSDNFPTRYLVNDACVLLRKPLVFGSVLRFNGQLSVFDARRGPCYRCLFPEPPPPGTVPSCAEGGVLGVLPGIIGSLQALEALKLVLGQGESLIGRLLLFEGLGLDFREVRLGKDPDCPVCGEAPTITRPEDLALACDDVTEPPVEIPLVSPEDLAASMAAGNAPRVLDVRRPEELAIAELPGALAIPLAELPGHLDDLARDKSWVITCHKGARAERAWQLMHDAGFQEIRVLEGGIDAWAERVASDMPRYA
ncbi:MAG: molybdopterin-synthase adenylyltransferase MoeB [Pseudomonadota bacterium]